MGWGFLQYYYVGRHRNRRGGGGPGLSRPPERLLSTGPYAVTRNPMYLGHLIFLAGLSLFTRSPLAAVITAAHGPWFQKRVEGDEAGLERLFGDEYREYCERVPRWFPRLS
ncbi:MAG: methyltransferase family protein [Thermoleophilia bacterium]